MTRAWRSWWVPVVALVALLGSLGWMLAQGHGTAGWGPTVRGDSDGYGSMTGRAGPDAGPGTGPGTGPMMRGRGSDGSAEGTGAVADLSAARAAATTFAQALEDGATIGEVMQFENGYYAEVVDADGQLATEVLVDPATGQVQIEYGPARMWNTRFGMMATGSTTGADQERISAAEAETIADTWLAARGDRTAGEAEHFPGYYTLHVLHDGQVDGMLSVHATTGDVWPHTWHGGFVDLSEAP